MKYCTTGVVTHIILYSSVIRILHIWLPTPDFLNPRNALEMHKLRYKRQNKINLSGGGGCDLRGKSTHMVLSWGIISPMLRTFSSIRVNSHYKTQILLNLTFYTGVMYQEIWFSIDLISTKRWPLRDVYTNHSPPPPFFSFSVGR